MVMMMHTLLRITLLTIQEHDDDDVYFVKDNTPNRSGT